MKFKKQESYAALQRDPYHSPQEAEQIAQRKQRPFWAAHAVIGFITVCLSALDAVVLYSILDRAMRAAWVIQLLTAVGIALILNVIPLAVARFAHEAEYRTKKKAKLNAVLCSLLFVIIFAGTVILRFTFQAAYTANNSSRQALVNEVSVSEANTANATPNDENNNQNFALAFLLSMEPLATSGVNFFLAYISADPLRSEINRLRRRRLELKEVLCDLQAGLASMEEGKDQRREMLYALDEQRFQAACDLVIQECNMLKAKSRLMLAEHLKEAGAISHISADALAVVKKETPVAPYSFDVSRPRESA